MQKKGEKGTTNIAKQKSMVDQLAFSARTPRSAALDFSSFVACLITKRATVYTKGNEGTTDPCAPPEGVICANCDRDGLVRHFLP